MVMDYTVEGDSFRAGKPRRWSEKLLPTVDTMFATDLAPDGSRVAVLAPLQEESPKNDLHVTFLLNFFDELTRRSPVGK